MRERAVVSMGLVAIAATCPLALGDVYGPGPGGPIPDAAASNVTPGIRNSDIVISDQGSIASLNNVTITFALPSHSWVGDLQIILTAPNGDNVHLISRPGATGPTSFGDASDFAGTYVFVNSGGADFSAAAAGAPAAALVPPGTYNRETNPLVGALIGVDNDDYTVFNGDAVAGTWTLAVKDWGVGDTGVLSSWSMDISLVPAPGSLALLGLAGLIGVAARRRRLTGNVPRRPAA